MGIINFRPSASLPEAEVESLYRLDEQLKLVRIGTLQNHRGFPIVMGALATRKGVVERAAYSRASIVMLVAIAGTSFNAVRKVLVVHLRRWI